MTLLTLPDRVVMSALTMRVKVRAPVLLSVTLANSRMTMLTYNSLLGITSIISWFPSQIVMLLSIHVLVHTRLAHSNSFFLHGWVNTLGCITAGFRMVLSAKHVCFLLQIRLVVKIYSNLLHHHSSAGQCFPQMQMRMQAQNTIVMQWPKCVH